MKEKDIRKIEEIQALYENHIVRAMKAREAYHDTRMKARNKFFKQQGYLSMIIDAGGGSGCTHIPRFQNTEKGEPSRHNM